MYTYRNRFDQEYFLHTRQVDLRHHTGTIHFFSKQMEGAREDLPAGYTVREGKNGFPTLKRIG